MPIKKSMSPIASKARSKRRMRPKRRKKPPRSKETCQFVGEGNGRGRSLPTACAECDADFWINDMLVRVEEEREGRDGLWLSESQ